MGMAPEKDRVSRMDASGASRNRAGWFAPPSPFPAGQSRLPCRSSSDMESYFAPAERAPIEVVLAQNRSLEGRFQGPADSLAGLVVVVNRQRQVVFASKAVEGICDSPLGRRPGELLGCIHAAAPPAGCGTTYSCRLCGAVQAILEAQDSGGTSTRECRLTVRTGDRGTACNFLVTTIPFSLEEERYVLVSFRDISQQKRKAALERIFFHDLLNTAASLKVYISLLKGAAAGAAPEYLPELEAIADSLVEEIRSQKMLVAAENGTLSIRNDLVVTGELVRQVIALLRHDDVARDRRLEVAGFSESLGVVTDAAILKRVLVNAVRNALEASPPGAAVTVGSRRRGDNVVLSVHNPAWMEEEVQLQLFQRYFSTKGENRGLGTYSMKLLTEEYLHGRVSFSSTPEEGTTFRFELPLKP